MKSPILGWCASIIAPGLVVAAIVGSVGRAGAQVADAPDEIKANIPVNYTEAKVGDYSLPDPLNRANGRPVLDAQIWYQERRPEIVRLFEENQYGRSPTSPASLTFEVFDQRTPSFEGKAIRKQVTVYFNRDKSGPKMELLIYLPATAGTAKKVPLLLNASFTANSLVVDDPGVKAGEIWDRQKKQRVPAVKGSSRFGRLNVMPLLELGIGVATVNYTDMIRTRRTLFPLVCAACF